MKSAIAFFVAVTLSFFSIPSLQAEPVDPASLINAPMAEKAYVPEVVAASVGVTYTPGLTSTSVTTLSGNPLPRIMDGSSSATSASLSSGRVAVKYDVKTTGMPSGFTVDFDNYATAGQETADLSSLSKITVGLVGTVNAVNVKIEDVNGNAGIFQLTQVSSSATRYWNMDLGLLDSSVDKTRIKAIHFYVEQAGVAATKLTGTFYVSLNGLDVLKPEAPVLDSGTPAVFGQKTVAISGTKEAYSSVYVRGILVALADSSTTWTATVALGAEGNNTVSLVSKSALGVASATRNVILVRDTTPPTGTIKINNGAASTTSVDVTLNLTASDTRAGVDAMCFSVDGGQTWTEWEPFAATRALTLPSGFGTNEVQYQVRDKLGNTATYKDTIKNMDAVQGCLAFSQALADALKDSTSAWDRENFKETLMTYDSAQRQLLLSGLSPRDQGLVRMLLATKQTVAEWITDDQLKSYATHLSDVRDSEPLFNRPDFVNNLAVLDTMDPQSVMAFVDLLADISGYQFTWAAQSWAAVQKDARLNAFARHSTLVKLLVVEGTMTVPTSTHAYFTWSGIPDIWIDLPPVTITLKDAPGLTQIYDSGIEPYRILAAKWLPLVTKPEAPALYAGTPEMFNQKTVTIYGVKSANSSVYLNGKLIVENNSSTGWRASITLVEGNNTISLMSKSVLGAVSGTRKVTLVRDMTPPAGSIKINNGAATTGSPSVILNLTASDTRSGVDAMRFSVDGGQTWSEWEPFAATKGITLTPGYATKEVQYQVQDKLGNAATYKDTILYVPATPVVTSEVPAITSQKTLTLSGTKDAQTSILINGKVVVPLDNATMWTITVTLGVEGNNVLSITSKNSAGKSSTTQSIAIIRDTTPPSGSIKINNGAASTSSTSVTLNLKASDARSGIDAMRFSVDGGVSWTSWEAFTATKMLTLPDVPRTQRVDVQYTDKAGNISGVFSDTIILT